MSRKELKEIIDEVLGADTLLDLFDVDDVAVYTLLWEITPTQINELIAKGVNITSIYAEGSNLTIRVNNKIR